MIDEHRHHHHRNPWRLLLLHCRCFCFKSTIHVRNATIRRQGIGLSLRRAIKKFLREREKAHMNRRAMREAWPRSLQQLNLMEPSKEMQRAARSLLRDDQFGLMEKVKLKTV